MNIEKPLVPTLDTSNDLREKIRNMFFRPFGKSQPFTSLTQIEEPSEEADRGLTTISLAHDNKSGEFGTTKRVNPRYINLKIFENFTEELSKGKLKI